MILDHNIDLVLATRYFFEIFTLCRPGIHQEKTRRLITFVAEMISPSSNLILQNVARHITLDIAAQERFLSRLTHRTYKRKEYLLEVNQPCNTFNFVNQGAFRAFYRGEDDKESTIMFAMTDWWITDMPCFIAGKPAMISIETISPGWVWQLTKADMDTLVEEVPRFERYFRILMQNAYIREQLRMLQTLSLPAETRYANFMEKYPSILPHVTQKHIASYLGITPEFLSVIRNKISKTPIS